MREIVEANFSAAMDPHEAAALFWFVRNSWLFELNLDRDPRVMICGYEELVRDPAATVKRMYGFLGRAFRGERMLPAIHQDSAGQGAGLEFGANIEGLCGGLLARFDALRSR